MQVLGATFFNIDIRCVEIQSKNCRYYVVLL